MGLPVPLPSPCWGTGVSMGYHEPYQAPRLPSPVSRWLLVRIFCCFSFSFMISIIFFLVTWSTPRLLNLEKRDLIEIWECQDWEQTA